MTPGGLEVLVRNRVLAVLAALGCAGCTGCTGGDDDATCEPAWTTVTESFDGALLAAVSDGAGSVYLAGGSVGTPSGARGLRYGPDRSEVFAFPVSDLPTLWWVWPTADGQAWWVGERGTVAHWDGSELAQPAVGLTDANLFGVWGAGPNDVWMVGGDPGATAEGDKDVVLHWNGVELTRDDTVPARGAALFKVWGAGSDDVWVVGESGTLLHRTGGAWIDESARFDTTATILTVHGCSASEVYAVGGQNVFSYDGAQWSPVQIDLRGFANGVSCDPAGVLVVGNGGLKMFFDRSSQTWLDERFNAPFSADFHGALVDIDGSAWAVGGNFLLPNPPERIGVIGHRGCEAPAPPTGT